METKIKIEKLNIAAEKAQNTINRVANWEANRNNAAGRLFAINAATTILDYINEVVDHTDDEKEQFDMAADYLRNLFMSNFNAQVKARAAFEASFSAIKAAATPEVLAFAVNARGFQFDAAIRGCYQAIKAAAKQERAAAWVERTAAAAERAATKSKNAAKRAKRAAERAAAVNGNN